MDRGARSADGAANPPIVTLTTDAVEQRHRASLMGDTMARELAGGEVRALDHRLQCNWQLAPLGPGTVLGHVSQSGFTAARRAPQLRDGDADLSIFFGLRGTAPFDQNGRRVLLGPGEALLIAHGRPVQSWWPDGEVMVLRLPRAALRCADRIDGAGGLLLPEGSPIRQLMSSYVSALWPLVQDGTAPDIAVRHLAELTDLALDQLAGQDVSRRGRGAAVQAARLARMREAIRRRYADPALNMAALAAAEGMSERAGYLLFEAAGESFTATLHAVRLDRAAERIRAGHVGRIVDLAFDVGFADPSHFNRRFRQRFGMTPSEMRGAAAR